MDTETRHPYLLHLARVAEAEAASPHRQWTPNDGPMPSVFLSHGAPPLFEDADWMSRLHDWARSMPKPKAILIVSAHWESAPLMLSAANPADLVYDFGGFPRMYYEMRYDTPDGSALASQVAGSLDGLPLFQHPRRGLDHGAWVPLKAMYPAADVPVLQLSLPTEDGPELLSLGRRLATLRQQGVLVVGSGHMTHGLRYVDWHDPNSVPSWSSEFDAWADEALQRGDLDELMAFRDRAPGMPYSHPTAEHFLPLLVAAGAAGDSALTATTVVDGYLIGLSKRSVQFNEKP